MEFGRVQLKLVGIIEDFFFYIFCKNHRIKKTKKHQNYHIITYICRINKNIEFFSIYFHQKVRIACYARTVNYNEIWTLNYPKNN